jgi:hypothetical protein
VRRAVYGRTRKEAADKLADLIAKTSAGVPLATRSWTVAGYAAHWLDEEFLRVVEASAGGTSSINTGEEG